MENQRLMREIEFWQGKSSNAEPERGHKGSEELRRTP